MYESAPDCVAMAKGVRLWAGFGAASERTGQMLQKMKICDLSNVTTHLNGK
jgi:hypothetical protein